MSNVDNNVNIIAYTSFRSLSDYDDIIEDKYFFKHLSFADQTYTEHFGDSMSYCWCSLRAAGYFFIHALWPDLFIRSGSEMIHRTSRTILEKYKHRLEELEMIRENRNTNRNNEV